MSKTILGVSARKYLSFLAARILGIQLFTALLAACTGGAPRPPEALATATEFERRGSEMYDAGDYAGAILQFERAYGQYGLLDRREAMLRNRIYAAQSALLINDLPRARSALDGLAELIDHRWLGHGTPEIGEARPQRYRLRLLQSEYLIRSRQYTEALEPLADIIDADDAPPEIRGSALVNRVRIAAATGASDRDLWLQRAQSSISAGLNQSRLLRLQAFAFSADGRHDQAEALLLRALENYRHVLFQPGIAATLGELGRLMEARHALAEARFYFRRALALRLHLQDISSAIELTRRLQELETRAGAAAAAETYEKQRKELESMLTSRDSQL